MPIRIASMTRQISQNGQALHRAMMSRIEVHGADHEPSEAELVLIQERALLKEERGKRQAQAMEPKARAADRLVRTPSCPSQRQAECQDGIQRGQRSQGAQGPQVARREESGQGSGAGCRAQVTEGPAK